MLLPFSLGAQTANSNSIVYVLQGAPESRLVKLSLRSQEVEVMAAGVGDVAFIGAKGGGFFVLGKTSLHQVSVEGRVHRIVQYAESCDWSALAQLDDESVIVMDHDSDWLLKISASGTISKFAQIPHARKPSLVADLIKVGEMFYLFRLGHDESLAFYKMDGLAAIQQIQLSGTVRKAGKPAYAIPSSGDSELAPGPGPLLHDGADGFYFVDIDTTRSIFHLSKNGVVKKRFRLDGLQPWRSRLMFDKEKHRILVPSAACLFALDPDEARQTPKQTYCNSALSNPQQWMFEAGDVVSRMGVQDKATLRRLR